MPEHRVRKNKIIFIIPNDELFEKWKNDEAFIDDYGRLINRKTHRVLRELKFDSVIIAPNEQGDPVTVSSPPKQGETLMECVKNATMEGVKNAVEGFVYYQLNRVVEEVLPEVWEERIVPFCKQAKEALTAKELKAQTLLSQAETSEEIAETPRITITQQEADVEKRKALYHWLGMLNSLMKLHDAGEIDANIVLAQLTDPARLQDVNCLLSEHPNLLEADQHITLHSLLGRNLYEEKQLIPITAEEIITIAETYGYAEIPEKTEENHNGRSDDF